MNVFFLAILTLPSPICKPTLAPVPDQCIIVWESYTGRVVITTGWEDAVEETRPQAGYFDPFAGWQEYDDHSFQVKRTISYRECYRRAWSRAQVPPDVPCCWPGEQVD